MIFLLYFMLSPPEDFRVGLLGRSLALAAFSCGLCSGPVAFGLALLGGANHLPEETKELIGLLALVAVLGGALAFGCVARFCLPAGASASSRRFANIAVAAPPVWSVAIAAFIIYALVFRPLSA